MSRIIHPDTLAALSAQHIRWIVFAKVEFDFATLAFNTSFRNRVLNGETYLGSGDLGNVSRTTEGSSLDPSEYSITFSGVNDTVLNAAATEDYLNKKAEAYVAVLDGADEIIGEPFLWFAGLTDNVDVEYGKISVVTVNVRDRLTDWSRSRVRRYTDGEQQEMYPGDKGLEFVTEVASREVVWPSKVWFKNNA